MRAPLRRKVKAPVKDVRKSAAPVSCRKRRILGHWGRHSTRRRVGWKRRREETNEEAAAREGDRSGSGDTKKKRRKKRKRREFWRFYGQCRRACAVPRDSARGDSAGETVRGAVRRQAESGKKKKKEEKEEEEEEEEEEEKEDKEEKEEEEKRKTAKRSWVE
ncbi:PREDICTED: uncharacterized protein C53C9.2-like isoform X1 [Acromyrmex echinatior]|uniref:uncharacterized protein C53C9.2-like isoform X1 n=1 Tax=Acromyrmex echinatior TaxID=103372 RepID=UPI000580BF15|nr:PREDICTED: uncharacterized protein C53C9.2-like isoform X1 [Acromyrmex echinatior]